MAVFGGTILAGPAAAEPDPPGSPGPADDDTGPAVPSPWSDPWATIDHRPADASAQTAPPQAPAAERRARAEPDDKAADRDPTVRLKGRVFFRNTVVRPDRLNAVTETGWVNQLAVSSARLGVKARQRDLGLEIEVDSELSDGEIELRDSYVRLSPRRWLRIQAGRFKRPISAVALASKWQLPVLERGLISDLEQVNSNTTEPDRLPLGGRSEGVSVRLRTRLVRRDTRLTVGVFRGQANRQLDEARGDLSPSPITLGDGFPEDLYSRLEVEVADGVRVSAALIWFTLLGTAGTRDTFGHGLAGGLDMAIDRAPLQLWLEVFTGTNPLHLGTEARARGAFVAARVIAATRIAIPSSAGYYIEPYLAGQVLDSSHREDNDRGWQLSGGVNLGLGRHWRVQSAVERVSVGSELFGSGTQISLQLGAVF